MVLELGIVEDGDIISEKRRAGIMVFNNGED